MICTVLVRVGIPKARWLRCGLEPPILGKEGSMPSLVMVLNGPNLNLLGQRQPVIYGYSTLADVERDCRTVAREVNLELVLHQSNLEYEIVDWIHEARGEGTGI